MHHTHAEHATEVIMQPHLQAPNITLHRALHAAQAQALFGATKKFMSKAAHAVLSTGSIRKAERMGSPATLPDE